MTKKKFDESASNTHALDEQEIKAPQDNKQDKKQEDKQQDDQQKNQQHQGSDADDDMSMKKTMEHVMNNMKLIREVIFSKKKQTGEDALKQEDQYKDNDKEQDQDQKRGKKRGRGAEDDIENDQDAKIQKTGALENTTNSRQMPTPKPGG